MNLFRRPDYRSNLTQFLAELKHRNPELDEEQRAGRALLWDRDVDAELNAEMQSGRVAQQPYVYQTQAD